MDTTIKNEQWIINKILEYASQEDNVKAVIRTNIVLHRKYQYSYEFYIVVENIAQYEADNIFENIFGDRILLYRGDRNYPDMLAGIKAHLMVFRDGITLVINAIEKENFMKKYLNPNFEENVWISDTYKVLLDKQNEFQVIEKKEEEQLYFFSKPNEYEFKGTCSEFYWVLKSFAEYILREELPAAMFYLNNPVRDMLNKMVRWYISIAQGKPVELGVLDSNILKYLPETFSALYIKTYSSAHYDELWKSFDSVVELFHSAGIVIANEIKCRYPEETERDMLRFIDDLKNDRFICD